jgi:predicted DNA-binding transcriptional regulator AlpA
MRMTRKILRLEQIAERTGVPLATLRWYRHRGEGPRTWRLGRRVVAYEDDVNSWLDQQAQAAGAARPA